MYTEVLLHAMVVKSKSRIDINSFIANQSFLAEELSISGCFLNHKSEVLQYVSGRTEAVLKFSESLNNYPFLSLKKELFSEKLPEVKYIGWSSVLSATACSEIYYCPFEALTKIEALIVQIKQSVGVMLFSSVAEIILSERLYKLD